MSRTIFEILALFCSICSADAAIVRAKRKYSFSDRCRYYLPQENVKNALAKLLTNLKEHPVPLPLLSQYMPFQYTMVREGKLNNTPEDLIKARVMYTIEEYTYASHQEELVH